MPAYYAKRALEILREEGIKQFFNSTSQFVKRKTLYRGRIFKLHTCKNILINNYQYSSYPDPYKPILCNPNKIDYYTKYPYELYGLGQVVGGEWDRTQNLTNLEEHPTVKGLRERFIHGNKWEDTSYYHYAKKKYESGGSRYNYPTFETFCNKRLPYVDELYQKINESGYKSNDEEGHNFPYEGSSKYDSPVQRLEVLVHIGRSGQVIHTEGFHRVTIAQILELEIPVQVVARHKQWQELREEIHNNGLPEGREDLRDHPDLQDVIED